MRPDQFTKEEMKKGAKLFKAAGRPKKDNKSDSQVTEGDRNTKKGARMFKAKCGQCHQTDETAKHNLHEAFGALPYGLCPAYGSSQMQQQMEQMYQMGYPMQMPMVMPVIVPVMMVPVAAEAQEEETKKSKHKWQGNDRKSSNAYGLQKHHETAMQTRQRHVSESSDTSTRVVEVSSSRDRSSTACTSRPTWTSAELEVESQPDTPRKDSCQEDETGNNPKSVLVEAVTSLYEDRLIPHNTLVLRRIEENSGLRWSNQHLRLLCGMVPEVKVQQESNEVRRYNILLEEPPKDMKEFVDQLSPDDPYPPELWLKVKTFLEEEALWLQMKSRLAPELEEAKQSRTSAQGWPSSRYEFAKWMRARLHCLAEYSLGHICHLVQLCIVKKELLGYRLGHLAPYQLSDECKKKSSALLNIPTRIHPGEKYAQSWEEAGSLIADVVNQNLGAVQLSSLKLMCRKMCQMELSESAFGHAKLSQFLQDRRLRSPSGGSFELQMIGMRWNVVHKEATSTDEEAEENKSNHDANETTPKNASDGESSTRMTDITCVE